MEGCFDKSMFLDDDTIDISSPLTDPREAKYQLAGRLIDNIRFGEAIRILETLGDYRDSRAMLDQVRAWKAYQDTEDTKLKAERRQQALERAEREARDQKRRRTFYIAAVILCVIALALLR